MESRSHPDTDRVLCIVGPTASGKSALADEIAVRLSAPVISIDAMQVYRGLDIGTAKTPVDERRAELLMVDIADMDEDLSAVRFRDEARTCIDDLLTDGTTPILCGGTGLYLDAVIDEMDFPSGELGSERRAVYEDYAAAHGADALWAMLDERDHASASLIHPNNVRRVVRALEMADEGRSYAEGNANLHRRRPHYDATLWAIQRDRDELYRRIDTRVDVMFSSGLVQEVEGLLSSGLATTSTALQAIGYKEVVEALSGSITIDEARELIKQRSRRYAKRQLSWIRRDGRANWLDMDRLSTAQAADVVLEAWKGTALG